MDNLKRKSSDLSHAHQSRRKKSTRIDCPGGCNGNFSKIYFNHCHKTKYFCDGKWLCSDNGGDSERIVNVLPRSESDDEPTPIVLKEQLRKHIQKHVKQYVADEDVNYSSDDSLHEDTADIWENIMEDDIDADLGCIEEDTVTDSSHSNQHASLVLCFCIFLCTLQVVFGIPDVVVAEILRFVSTFFELLGIIHPVITPLAVAFPGSIYMLWKSLNVKKDSFKKYVVCKKCYSLYKPEDCSRVLEGNTVSRRCTYVAFPNHTQRARRKQCGEVLMRSVTLSNGKTKLYPYKTYCYKPIEATFKRFLRRRNFEASCEKWRNRSTLDDVLTDVYDGAIWKYFKDRDTQCFLQTRRNYGIMLNLDWFQPFKHISYSVGVIYGVVLNLPRHERFKLENVLLIGIIPDMNKEPSTNTFIQPLVDELLESWNTGFTAKTFQSPTQRVPYKVALMCTGCDVPATRKLCGFLGHTARLGCSKCLKEFPGAVGSKDYSGFDHCEERKLESHKDLVRRISKAKTPTERSQMESEYGVRNSCLLALPYFDPIRMSIIDPMHNFFLGTAKHMIRVWQSADVLTADRFGEVQTKCDNIITPTTVGRLPRKIASSFGGFTAEQFMLWTNLFSLMTLPGIIETKYILHWQKFVLASRIICLNAVTTADLDLYDKLIVSFCKKFEVIFGKDLVTPNMHLHLHMSQCIRDYGPVNGFWLFSFERYNGHLGSMPNNSRSVEIQFMRRFQRDNIVNSIELPAEILLKFSNSLAKLMDCNTSNPIVETNTGVPGNVRDWQDIANYETKHISSLFLSECEHTALEAMYSKLYPEVEGTIPHSCNSAKAIEFGTDIIGTSGSRYRRSSKILAIWNAGDGKIMMEGTKLDIRAGKVSKIIRHNFIVDGKSQIHVLVKVEWYIPYSELEDHCFSPVKPYRNHVFDTFGESSWMPVQNIICSFVEAEDTLLGKSVKLVCPIRRV